MASWTLAEIMRTVRLVTGRLDTASLTDARLKIHINRYLQHKLPFDLKIDRNYVTYEFLTVKNTFEYDVPSGYTNFDREFHIDNQCLQLYFDPDLFSRDNPETYNKKVAGTGDGATTAFSVSASTVPIKPGTFYAADNIETFRDTNTEWIGDSTVVITGSAGGTATVDYSGGDMTATFNTAPESGENVNFSWISFVAGRPYSILYFNNKFKVYPVPDQSYKIVSKAWKVPDELTSATETPPNNEWGPLIAYGAAMEIATEYGEMDLFMEMSKLYQDQVDIVMSRTYQDLLNQRATPHF